MISVLIIDQSSVIRRVGDVILSQFGLNVSEASSAADGLLKCQQDMPQIILFDVGLQDMTIEQFRLSLSKYPMGDQCYLVYCAPIIDQETRLRAQQLGVDNFLLKPFTQESVHKLLERLNINAYAA